MFGRMFVWWAMGKYLNIYVVNSAAAFSRLEPGLHSLLLQ